MFKGRRFKNPMLDTIVNVKGNERACLWTEPLWGIPFNLYYPFVSVYMARLGLTPIQIGMVSTIYLLSQMLWAFVSGTLTDKLGRRPVTLYFDFFAWSIPMLIWMCAQNYAWFVVAALLNGTWRVTENSWGLLLVEEAPPETLVRLYSICHIAGLISAFVAPVAGIFVQSTGVVPTMRVLYGITFVLMTAKFIILYFMSHETAIGVRRMQEYRHVSLLHHLAGSRHILVQMLRDPKIMLTVALLACYATMKSVADSFWPLLVTEKLGIAEQNLSIFSTIRSLLMLGSFFVLVPRVSALNFKRPLLTAFTLMGITQLMMLVMPRGAYGLVLLGVVLEALALSVLAPLTASLQMLSIDPEERARMLALFCSMTLLVTSPFGAIAGYLSQLNRAYPFALNLGLTALALWISLSIWRLTRREQRAAEGAPM